MVDNFCFEFMMFNISVLCGELLVGYKIDNVGVFGNLSINFGIYGMIFDFCDFDLQIFFFWRSFMDDY